MICTDCGKPVFDAQDLIDGLCPDCVDKLLTLHIPSNDGGYERKPTKKSVYCGTLGVIKTQPIKA